MKRISRLFCCFSLISSLTCMSAMTGMAAPASIETYTMDVVVTGECAYKALALTPLIYTQSSLDALRIIEQDADGISRPVPYFIHSAEIFTEVQTEQTPLHLYNQYEKDAYYYLDFSVETPVNIDPAITHLRLTATQTDFVKRITVLGSYDGRQWATLNTEKVYTVAGVENAEIDLNGVQNYHYYRLMIAAPQERIDFSAVGIRNQSHITALPFTGCSDAVYSVIQEAADTVITITGLVGQTDSLQNIKLTGITVEADGMFKRNVTLNGTAKTIYQLIFREEALTDMHINLPGIPQAANAEMRIHNYDDSPLEIRNIVLTYGIEYLIFKAAPGRTYTLAYGGSGSKPTYDIEDYKSHILAEGYDLAWLTGEARLAAAALQTDEKDFGGLFNAAIISAGVVLVGLAAISVRKQMIGGRENNKP